MDINFITHYKKGLEKNILELKNNEMYQKKHGASFFKSLYDSYDKNEDLKNQDISTVIGYLEDEPVAVLIFFHKKKNKFVYADKEYVNVGNIGIFVKEGYRQKGIAKKLIKEFESNFINEYKRLSDYIIINAYEDAYEVYKKSFNYFIPTNKKFINKEMIKDVMDLISLKHIRSFRYQIYQNKKEVHDGEE